MRPGIAPALTTGIAALCLAAGFGAGYVAHGPGGTPARTASAAATSSAATITVHGDLILSHGAYVVGTVNDCSAGDGYGDISPGTAVTVGDQTGATIAVGRLQSGQLKRDGAGDVVGCAFEFDVPAPADRTSYTITISHRGTQVFSPVQAQEADMTLG